MTSVTESTWTVPTPAQLGTELAAIDLPALVGRHGTPLLVLDPARIAEQYRALRRALPDVRPYYAVKALSHRAALAAVRDEGGFFDVASPREVALVTELGVAPDRCIYTHPVKKPADVAAAVRSGIRTFVFDNEAELDKFAGLEHDVELLLRLQYRTPQALIDLSYKYGARPDEALDLLRTAQQKGLRVTGLSFHPGSQLASAEPLLQDIQHAAMLIDCLADVGVDLDVLDIGGGLPVPYDAAVPHLDSFVSAIAEEIRPLTRRGIQVISEPGRFVAAPAMLAVAGVVGVTRRGGMPWYYLDDGLYGSFSNVLSDHVHPTVYAYDAGLEERETLPSVLAGPTCDSTDVITTSAMLPAMEVGDLVVAPFMGAYTSVTACEFNGLPKATVVVV
ncbi:type III PLP-dependent enzyme [Blastococcus sp. CT_GayMR20]|uniref:type III PLP-dependent enzyme n=1 Tax=Blastococcus sp. CT_GayMR20 TaxID=2559609 RepID=UPI00107440C2|nr:type III PLP-dependent enzyme [Blastococcus sp. CT_GayMR20]TFV92478.1 type III PLP-dependent enzyme [Blastococcus sp. CT_GayMR20]TFV92493.1 type III PLP-dependent enzyme [Blastococcus sp. CT_GayMR20]